MIVNPYGRIISEISDKEKLIVENLYIYDILKIREEFNTKRDRRLSLYKEFYIQ
ncbi:MAG: hypothetical protein LBI80_04480 [Endomicrobium sp.]|nr:hypothetical protein [Endomicrobium sp.]